MNREINGEIGSFVINMEKEPDYYNKNGLSPLKAFPQGLLSKEEYMGFLKGNIIKYTIRCDSKNGAEDMDKCIDYCKHLREFLDGEIL